jgi:microsomal dipeptidase-like Zn-dependent dipeptidase
MLAWFGDSAYVLLTKYRLTGAGKHLMKAMQDQKN